MNRLRHSLFYVALIVTSIILILISNNISRTIIDIKPEKNYDITFDPSDNMGIYMHESQFQVGEVENFLEPVKYKYVSSYEIRANYNDNLEEKDLTAAKILLPIDFNRNNFSTLSEKKLKISSSDFYMKKEYFITSVPNFIDSYATNDLTSMNNYSKINDFSGKMFTMYDFSTSIYTEDSLITLPDDATVLYNGFNLDNGNELTFDSDSEYHVLMLFKEEDEVPPIDLEGEDIVDEDEEIIDPEIPNSNEIIISEDLVYYTAKTNLENVSKYFTNEFIGVKVDNKVDLEYYALLLKKEIYDSLQVNSTRKFDMDVNQKEDNILVVLLTANVGKKLDLTISYDAMSGYNNGQQNPIFYFTSFKNTTDNYFSDGIFFTQLYSTNLKKFESANLSPYWSYMNKSGFYTPLTNTSPDVILGYSKEEVENSLNLTTTLSSTIKLVIVPAIGLVFLVTLVLDFESYKRNKRNLKNIEDKLK